MTQILKEVFIPPYNELKEEDIFNLVGENIKKDLEELGIKVNFSIETIIYEIALLFCLIRRAKNLMKEKATIQRIPIFINDLKIMEPYKVRKNYEYEVKKEEIHPLYDDYILKLQKKLNYLFSLLGLLPQQQLERQKIFIVKTMRKKLLEVENKEGSYEVEAVAESKGKF